jgi:hypothetical protein
MEGLGEGGGKQKPKGQGVEREVEVLGRGGEEAEAWGGSVGASYGT